MKVNDGVRKRARSLASQPEIVVTSPEDGDRLPEPGQKGSRVMVVVEQGRLAAPKAVAKAGRQARIKRREERKKKRDLERAERA